MKMDIIRRRMERLGVDIAALTRRYCEIRQSKGDTNATPVNRRSMLSKAISDEGNPTFETLVDIITALDGRILVEWRDTSVEGFEEEDGK